MSELNHNSNRQPAIRFKGFTDPWEQRKLKELFSYKQGQQVPIGEQFFENKDGLTRFIRIVDLTEENEQPRYIKYDGNNFVKPDDLFMVRYGQPGLLGQGFSGVIANNLFRLIPKEKSFNTFYKYIFEYIKPKILLISSSTTMPAISFKSMDMLNLLITNLEEQKK